MAVRRNDARDLVDAKLLASLSRDLQDSVGGDEKQVPGACRQGVLLEAGDRQQAEGELWDLGLREGAVMRVPVQHGRAGGSNSQRRELGMARRPSSRSRNRPYQRWKRVGFADRASVLKAWHTGDRVCKHVCQTWVSQQCDIRGLNGISQFLLRPVKLATEVYVQPCTSLRFVLLWQRASRLVSLSCRQDTRKLPATRQSGHLPSA